MPMLHRHIVPSVADKDDNGKIVVGANGKPSHRRLIEFSIDFGFDWAPAFASDAWWESKLDAADISPSSFDSWVGPIDKTIVETQLNTPRHDPDGVYGYVTGYYGDPPGGYSNGVATYMYTGEHIYVAAPPGSSAPNSWNMNVIGRLLLDWDSNNQWWRWRFHIRNLALHRYCNLTGGDGRTAVVSASWGEIYLVSSQLTNDIRPGATGIALTPTGAWPASTGPYEGTAGATLYTAYA